MVIVIFAILLFAACQNRGSSDGGDPVGGSSPGATPSDSSSPESYNPNELNLSVFIYDDNHLKDAALIFEERTGIKVNIQNNYVMPVPTWVDYTDSDGHTQQRPMYTDFWLDTAMYEDQSLTALITCRGADIYSVGHLDYEQLGRNGLLVDMGGWLESDKQLTSEAYFRDFVLAGKTENGIFAISIDFTSNKLSSNSRHEPLLENKHRTWKVLFDEISEVEYTSEIAFWYTDIRLFFERFLTRASSFIDETKMTQNLYSEEMISLLEECKEWGDEGLIASYRDPATSVTYPSYGNTTNLSRIAEMFCTIPPEYQRASMGGIFLAPPPYDGDSVIIDGIERYPSPLNYHGSGLYGINAGTLKTEIAQDFLLFLLSEEIQEMMSDKTVYYAFSWPVNRTVFRSLVESDLKRMQTDERALDIPSLVEEAEKTADEIAYMIIAKPYYRTIIFQVAEEFFLGQITAEEAARQMSDKVSLYLKERG